MPTNDQVNEDLQRERSKCNFNVEELTHYLDGGADATNKRRDIENKIFSIKELKDEVPDYYLSHKDKYENAIRKETILYSALRGLLDYNFTTLEKYRENARTQLRLTVFTDESPFRLHSSTFVPALILQADEEQQSVWLRKAKNFEIIGTYAQTELGHGSFIRGIETTATYDPETEEFILHSPTLNSYKWWPGGLGHTTTHCVATAQLYINGKHYGAHLFIVQVREDETHLPLPGITLGEVGPKLGYNQANNGFLCFNQHRIPRRNMLMKNVQVFKDGTFKSSQDPRLAYSTMVLVRVFIVGYVTFNLSKAVTIAVRYSAIRKQSQMRAGEPESQVLDYVMQQHKLFIGLASSYAYWAAFNWQWDLYMQVNRDLEAGKFDRLAELHSSTCLLKALSTADSVTMIDQCRLSCGGHGYLASSSFPQLYGLAAAACIYEGHNTVLLLQVARYLVKCWNQVLNGEELASSTSYLSNRNQLEPWDSSVDGIVRGSQKVAAGKLTNAMASLERYMKSGLAFEDAFNKATVQLLAAVEAHGRALVLSVYQSEVKRTTANLSAPAQRVMHQLVELYAYYWTLERIGDFVLYTAVTQQDVQYIQRKYEDVLEAIRPNAVGLVDAFDFRDETLNSTLGAKDGRVYERLMEDALKSPLNQQPVNESFHKYLKPFLQKARL